jgi:hypothetical protein
MKSTLFAIVLLTFALLTSCGKDLSTPIEPDKVAIVESYLYAGDSSIIIKLTKLLPFSADTSNATEYISGMNLRVNGAALTETGNGVYKLQMGGKRIQPGESYILKFLYYSDTVSSITTIPERPADFSISDHEISTARVTSSSGGMPGGQMEDLDLTWTNDDGSYYYVLIEYLENTPDYINYYSATLDPSTTQSISPMSTSGTRLNMRELYFFGSYRIVLFKVTKDFVDLYQQTAANSNNITNPVTSIHNGYGVFTGMSSDTVFLKVLEN